MKTLKAVSEAENTVKRILSAREAETADLEEQVKKVAGAIEKANAAMEAATEAGDVIAYQKAKADRRDAADAKEMFENRLNALNDKHLISKRDYEKTIADIYDELEALDDQTKQCLAKLSEQMEAAVLELQEAQVYANEVLHRLQHEVYRDADRSRVNGKVLQLTGEDKKVDKSATILWGKAGVTHYQYKQYTGREAFALQESPKTWC